MGADEDGAPFLALELLEGTALDRLLSERGYVSPEQALAYLLPIVGALATLHDAGIVHREVKPSNIFLRTAARNALEPKLLDFGLVHTLSDRPPRCRARPAAPLFMQYSLAAGTRREPAYMLARNV